MSAKISRRKLADYTAMQLKSGAGEPITELAAYLVDHHRANEADLLVRDIEERLAELGLVVVTVVSAQPLTESARKDIEAITRERYGTDTEVRLREELDPELLGGVIIRTPREELDASVRYALNRLKASKTKEN